MANELKNRKAEKAPSAAAADANGKGKKAAPKRTGSCLSMLFIAVGLIASALAFSFVATNTLPFGYDIPNLSKYIPVGDQRAKQSEAAGQPVSKEETPKKKDAPVKETKRKEIVLTTEELTQYDGSDPSKPIYIAINGKVYDVTVGKKYYGKGGGYAFFAGKDAARAYITGCFDTHLVPDLRGLTPEEIASLSTWTDFYEKHDKYHYVGKVIHKTLTDADPIPPPCKQ